MNNQSLLFVFFCSGMLLSCEGNNTAETSDTVLEADSTDHIRANDTIFTFDGDQIRMSVFHNDTLMVTSSFVADADTIFYGDGCVREISLNNSVDYEVRWLKYDHDNILRARYTQYRHDGMGGTEASRETFDTTGRKTESEYNKDYFPDDGQGHLDVCGVVTTTKYYSNGTIQSVERRDHHYEGGYYCPCGEWEYRDSLGNITNREQYKKCGDGKTNCVDVFLEEQAKKDSEN